MTRKSKKRGLFIAATILLLIIAFIQVDHAVFVFGTTNVESLAKPVFSSSFIQHWYCENFDQARWEQELKMLQGVGVNEIILQAVAFTDSKYAAYPTKIRGYKGNDVDMLKNVLTVADSLSMKVRIGLGFNDEWWTKKVYDPIWLKREAAANKKVFNEIIEMYGEHTSLSGWYIPHEFNQITALTKKQQTNLNSFFKDIATEIKEKTQGQDIMISPFYTSKYSLPPLLPLWSLTVRNVLKGTGVDILALQDAVGASFNSIDSLSDIFAYTKRATDSIGVKLYSVTETFTANGERFVTAPHGSVTSQISAVRPYVQDFVAFSISHYQNANKPRQLDSANEYYDYYISNK